ncbi:cytochrome P450 [Coccomyxa subellipsoidea C-169]|uniref:Cytochrome P450 n=1 Tax=Coccomyxa subellipsoidea (strain C-169) TaxID=574566 RepID=I0YV44_COCSC|nr:cytochrome P450 [Coccomyxa subellipsoidea C-169]EIE22263.1 cytochrome P450 [Coccomyxa subellipsoidea C-169]|eukprot:XP_005646807.1 cytochrome P450 [Coccomyxa subellipsoidea C-169]
MDSLLLGHGGQLQKPHHHRWLSEMTKKLGNKFYMRLAHNHVLMISDPELVPIVFDRALYPPNANVLDRPVDQILHDIDVVTSNAGEPNMLSAKTGDPYWRLVRKGVAPAFNPQNIRQGFGHVVEAANQLIQVLKERGADKAVDIDDAAQRVALEVIGKVGFGKSFNSLASLDAPAEQDVFKALAASLEEVSKRMANPLRVYRFFDPIAGLSKQPFLHGCVLIVEPFMLQEVKKSNVALKKFKRVTKDLLEEVQARGTPDKDDPTIAGHLLRLRDSEGRPLSQDRLHAEFSVMFIGGTDTTGHTIANTLFLISQHPEVEAKITTELEDLGFLVGPSRPVPRQMEYSDLSKLTYLSAAIKESMRLMAVVGAGVARVANEQMQMGPYTIPKNTLLWVPLQALQTSPALWTQPDTYMPERWLEESAEYWSPQPSTTDSEAGSAAARKFEDGAPPRFKKYMPFGEGMRACVGQSLAKMNYTAATALLLSHFSFRLADRMGGPEGVIASEMARITVAQRDGMWMHALPRSVTA